jgi:GNAT superfamily N-acetyltransferase
LPPSITALGWLPHTCSSTTRRPHAFAVTTRLPPRKCHWPTCRQPISAGYLITPSLVARLARLAVALQEQGRGLGEAMVQDAVKRCLELRSELGIHALLVDALHERAVAFYRQYGFRETAVQALKLYLPWSKG